MTPNDVIRAWKDPYYRAGLSAPQRAQLPAHPAGAIELAEPTPTLPRTVADPNEDIPLAPSSWRSRRCTRCGRSRASASSRASEQEEARPRHGTHSRARNAAVSDSAAPRRHRSPATAGLGGVTACARARGRIAGSLAQAPQKEEHP
jgi:mersacidin/lichenicidin family type 2 lantibiotic